MQLNIKLDAKRPCTCIQRTQLRTVQGMSDGWDARRVHLARMECERGMAQAGVRVRIVGDPGAVPEDFLPKPSVHAAAPTTEHTAQR